MNDKRRMHTVDTSVVSRADLAGNYLSLLRAQPGRPIAQFVLPRVGRHFFDYDLSLMAQRTGMLPV